MPERAAVRHDEAVEPPGVAQRVRQLLGVLAGVRAVDAIVRAHDRAGPAVLHSHPKRGMVDLLHRALRRHHVDVTPQDLLVVRDEVLRGRDDVPALHSADLGDRLPPSQIRVLAERLRGPAPQRQSQDVDRRHQRDVVALACLFGPVRAAVGPGQRGLPGGGEGGGVRPLGDTGRTVTDADGGVGQVERGDPQPGVRRNRSGVAHGPGLQRVADPVYDGDLLIQRHPGDQQPGALLGRNGGIHPGAIGGYAQRYGGDRAGRGGRLGRSGEGRQCQRENADGTDGSDLHRCSVLRRIAARMRRRRPPFCGRGTRARPNPGPGFWARECRPHRKPAHRGCWNVVSPNTIATGARTGGPRGRGVPRSGPITWRCWTVNARPRRPTLLHIDVRTVDGIRQAARDPVSDQAGVTTLSSATPVWIVSRSRASSGSSRPTTSRSTSTGTTSPSCGRRPFSSPRRWTPCPRAAVPAPAYWRSQRTSVAGVTNRTGRRERGGRQDPVGGLDLGAGYLPAEYRDLVA
jgi:hypothetical protein